MGPEQNEFLAKIVFALFATLSVMLTKVHAEVPAFSTRQEKAVSVILERELHLQQRYRNLKVGFFRCDEQQRKCLAILNDKKSGRNIFCEMQDVEIADFKRSAFTILDPFYFNKIKSCL